MIGQTENASATTPARGAEPVQFSLATLFWLALIIGIAIAYLRSFGVEACLFGLAAAGLSLAVGAAVGGVVRRPADAIYWSLLGGVAAYLCTQGVSIPHWSAHFAWTGVGAAAGACAGVVAAGRPLRRMLVGGIAGGLVFAPYFAGYFLRMGELLPDVLVAPLAGGLLGALIEACTWAERRWPSRHARNLCAASLMVFVIAANLAASRFVPSW